MTPHSDDDIIREAFTWPLYSTLVYPDDIQHVDGSGRLTFMQGCIGGSHRERILTWRDTNLRRPACLPTPQRYCLNGIYLCPDLRGFKSQYLGALHEAVDEIRHASTLSLFIGNKSYFHGPSELVFANVSLRDDEPDPDEAPRTKNAPDFDPKKCLALKDAYKYDGIVIPSEVQIIPELEFDELPKTPFKILIRFFMVGQLLRGVM